MAEETLKYALSQGVAVAMLIAIGFAAWCGARWIAIQIVVPSRDRFFNHLDVTTETMRKLGDTMTTIGENVSETKDEVVSLKQSISCINYRPPKVNP